MSEHAHELLEPCPRCGMCGVPVAISAQGRPRKFCSDRCRAKAFRLRSAISDMVQLTAMLPLPIWRTPGGDWEDEHRVV